MSHILFGLPEISQFHLHSRLARKLMSRGHRVSVLAGDPVTFEFYCHQGLACHDLRPGPRRPMESLPLQEFAAADVRLRTGGEPGPAAVARAAHGLSRWSAPILELFATDRPDLVLIADGRSGLHRMLHFLAVQQDIRTLHVGPGLLPMTMQVDPEGIDGDSSFCRAGRTDYRRASPDERFLKAAVTSWLGCANPPPLARMGVSVPPVLARATATTQAVLRGQWRAAWHGMTAWESAHDLPESHFEPPSRLPPAPFGVVLLQPPNETRRRLDAPTDIADAELIEHARAAVFRADPTARTVVIAAPEGPDLSAGSWPDDVEFATPATGPAAVATAMAVISINHPLGLAGVLTDTPVLHLGRTPYGVPGISHRTSLETMSEDLQRALTDGSSTLRSRFLTRVLKEHHIWCPPELPDGNGISGLVLRMERQMRTPAPNAKPLNYRPGPVWPLAVV